MPNKAFEVTGHYRRGPAAVLGSFATQSEALSFARTAVDEIEPPPGDSLVSVAVRNTATDKLVSSFYPDFYEAESLDDDDDG